MISKSKQNFQRKEIGVGDKSKLQLSKRNSQEESPQPWYRYSEISENCEGKNSICTVSLRKKNLWRIFSKISRFGENSNLTQRSDKMASKTVIKWFDETIQEPNQEPNE